MQASVIPFDLHPLPRLLENGWLLVNLGGLVFLGPSATVGLVKLLPLQVGLWGWWLLVLVVVVNLLPLQVGLWGGWLLALVVEVNLVALVNLGGLMNLVALVNLGGLVNLVGLWCWGRLDISDSVCKEANLIWICHPFPSKTIGCCSREFGSFKCFNTRYPMARRSTVNNMVSTDAFQCARCFITGVLPAQFWIYLFLF